MDYKFTIFNQTGQSVKVTAFDEDKADWTNKKDPETVIVNAEIVSSSSHEFRLSGKALASDPWFKMQVKDNAGKEIASLYSKFDGNVLQEVVINDDNNTVSDSYVIMRTYSEKDVYSYSIALK